jgi:hypothetical protein
MITLVEDLMELLVGGVQENEYNQDYHILSRWHNCIFDNLGFGVRPFCFSKNSI